MSNLHVALVEIWRIILVSEITNDVKLIPFHQPKRNKGKTKNNYYTLYDLGIVGIIKHSKIPLRIITFIGLTASFLSFVISIIFLVLSILSWSCLFFKFSIHFATIRGRSILKPFDN